MNRTIPHMGPLIWMLGLAGFIAAGCGTPGPQGPAGEPGADGSPASAEGSISGTVSDTAGAPISGAVVVITPTGLETQSDGDGSFLLEQLGVGTYDLQVSAPGYLGAEIPTVPVAGGATTEVEVSLVTVTADVMLAVSVQGASGSPVEAAAVDLSSGESALTDGDGVATFATLDPGTIDVVITPPEASTFYGRTYVGIEVVEDVLTEILATLSGRPGPEAVYVGSSSCASCHPVQGATHSNSAHATAYSADPRGGLRDAIEAGSFEWLSVESGAMFQVTLGMLGDQPVMDLQPADGQGGASFPVVGEFGRDGVGRVLLTELDDGERYPLPVAWIDDDPDYPGYTGTPEGPVVYQPELWFDATGHLLSDPDTGYVDPSLSYTNRCVGCHETGASLLPDGNGGITSYWVLDATIPSAETAVGCERCHGPGSDHTQADFDIRADLIVSPSLLEPDRVAEVCGQCHSARRAVAGQFDEAPPFPYGDDGPFIPGLMLDDFGTSVPLTWDNDTARGAAQQADSLAASPHADNNEYPLGCLDCHDPHGRVTDGGGDSFRLQLKADPDDNSLCRSCHQALTFPTEQDEIDHTGHAISQYDPGDHLAKGRCTGCHMVRSSTNPAWDLHTGAGTLADHTFLPVPPQDTVDEFTAQGQTVLEVGEFPANSCMTCHRRGQWIKEDFLGDGTYFGPHGEPTEKGNHASLQTMYDFMFP